MYKSILYCLAVLPVLAQTTPAPEQVLLAMARQDPASPAFREALTKLVTAERLKGCTASVGYGQEFLFACESATEPRISIDDAQPADMRRLGDSNIWMHTATLQTGRSHGFYYVVGGKAQEKRTDVSAYGPDSYPQAGVPKGTLSEKMTFSSKLYPGMVGDYWVYVSPGYDAGKGAALMVWQDGQNFARENSPTHLITVTENLIAQKKIPPMIHVMISPGKIGERPMRAIEYDTVSDLYPRFVLEEILPEVEKKWKIRKDAYSRGIAGESSGGISAFNAAWFKNDQFSRVISRIGSYTSIEWNKPGRDADKDFSGGQNYPAMVRKYPKRNIRIWMEDGNYDLENEHGSWPLQNIQLANSLKMREYDFFFTLGNAQHNTANGNARLPEALTWLWRDYDPSKTEQTYTMDPHEKELPVFRVKLANR